MAALGAAADAFPLRPAKAWVAGPSPGFMTLDRRGKARSPGDGHDQAETLSRVLQSPGWLAARTQCQCPRRPPNQALAVDFAAAAIFLSAFGFFFSFGFLF